MSRRDPMLPPGNNTRGGGGEGISRRHRRVNRELFSRGWNVTVDGRGEEEEEETLSHQTCLYLSFFLCPRIGVVMALVQYTPILCFCFSSTVCSTVKCR